MARDILTVPVGGSVTIRCKEHAKYGGSLEWSLLNHSKPLPTNSLVKSNELLIFDVQVEQPAVFCQTTKGRLRWKTEFIFNVVPEEVPGATLISEFPTNLEAFNCADSQTEIVTWVNLASVKECSEDSFQTYKEQNLNKFLFYIKTEPYL